MTRISHGFTCIPIPIPPPTSLNRAYHKADVLVLTESNLTFFFQRSCFYTLKSLLCPKLPLFSSVFSTRSVIKCQLSVPNAHWGQTILKCWSLEQGKFYWKAIQGEVWLIPVLSHPPPQPHLCPRKVPNSWKGFSKAHLKVRWQRVMVNCCRLPIWDSFVLVFVHVGQDMIFL